MKRIAIVCVNQVDKFPSNATDDEGKLQLDFIQPAISVSSSLTQEAIGKTVIHKCCDLNEVFSIANHSCMEKQGYATQYFDDLLSDDTFFLRVGLLPCANQMQPVDYELTPSGRLRIKMDDDSEWLEQLLDAEDYCLDDFVVFYDDDLPETINLASFCRDNVQNTSTMTETLTEKPTNQLDVSEFYEQNFPEVRVPKCCPSGFIVENNECKRYGSGEHAKGIESNLIKSFRQLFPESINTTSVMIPNSTLACGFTSNYTMEVSDSWVNPRFQLKDDKISLSLKFFWKNYWNLEIKLEPFCLELKQTKSLGEVLNEATIYYCTQPSHVSGHYPILLYVSVIALLTTFILYFLIPASGKNSLICAAEASLRNPKLNCCFIIPNLLNSGCQICHRRSGKITTRFATSYYYHGHYAYWSQFTLPRLYSSIGESKHNSSTNSNELL